MIEQQKPMLMVHEWLAIAIIVGLLGMLAAIAMIRNSSSQFKEIATTDTPSNQWIKVAIDGAVESPGNYTVEKGTSLKEVLAQAKVLEDADFSRLKMKITSKVRQGQMIHVPKKQIITVFIQGNVEFPGALAVPKGTRLIDLMDKITFQDNADLQPLRKKRRLKDQEIIRIEKKQDRQTG